MTTEPARVETRESFSKENPKLQIAWDSTSLGTFKDCPRKYQLSIVEGWQGKGSNIHLRYGILYHRALEVYDHLTFDGMSHDDAVRAVLRDLAEGCQDWDEVDQYAYHAALETTEARQRFERDPADPENTSKFHYFIRKGWWNPAEGLSEKKAAANAKDIPNLFRTVVWYLERFGPNDNLRTVRLANGKPAVELSFRFEFGHTFTTGEGAIYSGHLDRLASDQSDDLWVVDRKTTSTTIDGFSAAAYFAKYSPDNQMSGYTMAGRVALAVPVKGVIIDAAQIAKGFSRFERGFVMRTEAQLEEWHLDARIYLQQANHFANIGYWPMNDKSCDKFGGCPFLGICSKDPSVREIFLKSNFTKRYWDPLSIRGDI